MEIQEYNERIEWIDEMFADGPRLMRNWTDYKKDKAYSSSEFEIAVHAMPEINPYRKTLTSAYVYTNHIKYSSYQPRYTNKPQEGCRMKMEVCKYVRMFAHHTKGKMEHGHGDTIHNAPPISNEEIKKLYSKVGENYIRYIMERIGEETIFTTKKENIFVTGKHYIGLYEISSERHQLSHTDTLIVNVPTTIDGKHVINDKKVRTPKGKKVISQEDFKVILVESVNNLMKFDFDKRNPICEAYRQYSLGQLE